MSEESVDIYNRAVRVFGSTGSAVRWPYGLTAPDRSLKLRDPAMYQSALHRVLNAQETILEWAERYGLKMSDTGCCPRWLQKNASRRCRKGDCFYSGVDHNWLDHPIAWLRDSLPVALTSAPYHVTKDDEERIQGWVDGRPPLRAAFGVGWYGMGTRQIVLWRPDRIDLAPATPKEAVER